MRLALALGLALAWTPVVAADFSPLDYGATFAGGHDDAPGWQVAVNAARAGHGRVVAPCGPTYLDSTVTISDAMIVEGGGRQCTTVISRVPAGNPALQIAGRFSATIRDLGVLCTKPGQIGIRVTSPAVTLGSGNQGSELSGLRVQGCAVGIDFANAMTWSLHDSSIGAPGLAGNIGVRINNEETDAGDSFMSSMLIVSGKPAPPRSVAILQLQSGGLKITTTKVLGWGTGYQLSQRGGQMSDLLITNSSFESITGGAIVFGRQAGVFHNAVITGNQFANVGGCVVQQTPGNWLGRVTVVGNRCSDGITFRGAVEVTQGLNK